MSLQDQDVRIFLLLPHFRKHIFRIGFLSSVLTTVIHIFIIARSFFSIFSTADLGAYFSSFFGSKRYTNRTCTICIGEVTIALVSRFHIVYYICCFFLFRRGFVYITHSGGCLVYTAQWGWRGRMGYYRGWLLGWLRQERGKGGICIPFLPQYIRIFIHTIQFV